ncbi:hypothetical protein V5N11_011018 [Cardamine amara subsp. amara]|uniref:carnosine N-methyltransferase n=1 Tax=Cardamine amara subsp. amara TaxID=228776 RepID=A0ABD1BVI0_CARAN
MTTTGTAPEILKAMATETEQKENDEEEANIRCQKKPEEALEAKSLPGIISAYLNYPEAAEENLKKWDRSYQKLSPAHKALVPHFPMKLQRLRRCISMNSHFIFNMLQAFEPSIDLSQHMREPLTETLSIEELQRMEDHGSLKNHFVDTRINNKTCGYEGGQLNHDHVSVTFSSHDWLDSSLQTHVPLVDVDKVRWVIRNIVRDWAAEGQIERDQCYKPILEELDSLFPDRQKESPPTCLVPGAGLGRLALEISCLGFISQGNEYSYYMIICSSFILNYTQVSNEWTIYPWIHTNCNSLSDNDQLRPISIPDIHPASVGVTQGFSMCGGDFVEVFNESSQAGMWDVVVTCFFIDTAHNVIEYIETISKILRDGGVWINLGPLLYHFADEHGLENEMSIELSLEDVKRVASHYGFVIEKERTIETTYSSNPRSMMKNRYYPAFWTMRKKCAITT